MPAVAEDIICGKLMAAGRSDWAEFDVSGRGCSGAKEVWRSWNRKDCTVAVYHLCRYDGMECKVALNNQC